MTDNFKKKLIYFFIGFSVFLMIANIVVDFFQNEEESLKTHEVSSKLLEEEFNNIIDEFGIDNSWIKVKNINNKNLDSLKKVYYVQIPTDLNIPIFIKEFQKNLLKQPVEVVGEERKDNGNSVIKISSNNHLKFQAYLNYDKSLSREKFQFAFLVNDFQDLSSSERKNILGNDLKMAVGLIPSESAFLQLEEVSKNKKENYLIIDDEISDSKYELDISFSKERLKSSIISIVTDFKNSIFFMIDKESELYKSTAYNFIKDEFLKRKIKLYSYENFIDLRGKEKTDLISLFKFYCDDSSKKKNIFLIDFNGINILSEAIMHYQKKGNRLINPSELLFSE